MHIPLHIAAMPQEVVKAYKPERWADLKALAERLWVSSTHSYVFRGQPDAQFKLETHLERSAKRTRLPRSAFQLQESWMLHEFQRQAHHYERDLPPRNSRLDWFALMRHHGAPTRLLDFTHSFYVATFFAIETATSDAAVWAVDEEVLADIIALRFSHEGPSFSDRRDTMERHNKYIEDELVQPSVEPTVVPVEPFQMNLRLASQQGLFLCPTTLAISFEECLLHTLGLGADTFSDLDCVEWKAGDEFDFPVVAKIVIPQSCHSNAIYDLRFMNVHARSLFGGLDGLARSMSAHLEIIKSRA